MSRPATMDLRDALELALREATRIGASDAEVVGAEGESLEAGVRLGGVEKLKRSRERRIAVRLFAGSSSAVCSSADLAESSITALVHDCYSLARATAPDPFAGLPDDPPSASPDERLDLYDSRAEAITAEEAIERARRCERAALAVDPRIRNSEGAEFEAATHRWAHQTSRGFMGEYRTTSFALGVAPVAVEGESMQQDSWYTAARCEADLENPEEVGRTAAARALRRLGARPVRTCDVPIVFDPEMAATLVGHFAAAACGTSVYRRTSFLRERMGDAVAAPGVYLVDDPLLPGRLGSRPFDGEGLPSRRNVVVAAGHLERYLLDVYSARKLAMTSTASAVRALGDVPLAGTSNFYLENGTIPPEDIVASVDRGLYVTELSGFGINPVTGDYSRGASGLWIEGGRLGVPVEEITIAGNLLEMFRGIEMIGNDLRLRTRIAAPTLKVARMTVAGEG